MNLLKAVATGVVGLAMVGTTLAAQAPIPDINAQRTPNLAEAQKSIIQAYLKIDESQKVTHDELKGHGEKAKQLLLQANMELKLAAASADQK